MRAVKKNIPIHKLENRTSMGFQMEWVENANEADVVRKSIALDAHRDDHYIFLFQQTGRSRMMVDFTIMHSKKNSLFFVLPGQVHKYIDYSESTTGWFIAVDTGLVPDAFRKALEDPLLVKKPVQLDTIKTKRFVQCLQLLYSVYKLEPATFYYKQAMYALLTTFIGMTAAEYTDKPDSQGEKISRPEQITLEFRRLLASQFRTLKSPAEYAAALNLSLSYLNEVVKACTGFAVSYWIHYEVILEAKRLLYHTGYSVKEIANELGYEDHAYFSRLFKKTVGQTPVEFRKRYRE
jgi:AraC family transcriptional regulator, transcriptional activator of pobA